MPAPREEGFLPANMLRFARILRHAGLPVGPGRTLEALRAAQAVGPANREDFFWALHAVFVNRADQRELFRQAFDLFWRNPHLMERMAGLSIKAPGASEDTAAEAASRRLAEAMAGPGERAEALAAEEAEAEAGLSWSRREVLGRKDFAQMSSAEMEEARAAVARMRLPVTDLPIRRWRSDPAGRRADLRTSLRAALRQGGDIIPLQRRSPRRRPPPLVLLCDISGSMDVYSRMLLRFMHAVTNDRDRVHSFLFGTRLTNITRQLRHRDIDVALGRVSAAVQDWAGGTRIGRCLHEFNRDWSRRVLAQGAVVLLISDGLDRDAGEGLAAEVQRLHRSCRRLVWLNPLLRYAAFEPKSLGVRAILPHVDEFRPVHNLDSLAALAEALSARKDGPVPGMRKWREMAA